MASSTTLRHINQARVLDALREQGTLTRVDLSGLLGLQRSTITVITAALIEDGLVREMSETSASNRSAGRPAVGLTLAGPGAYFAGLDLGNEVSTAIVVDLRGREVGRAHAATDTMRSPIVAEDALISLLREAMGDDVEVADRLQGIGITIPGMIADGMIEWAPFLGWRNVPFGERVREAFGVAVFLDNDANAAAVSEAQFGAGRDARDLLYVLLDLGVGAGVILDRTIYRGSVGRVGEAGHIRVPSFGSDPSTWPLVEDILGLQALRAGYTAAGGTAPTFDGFIDDLVSETNAAVAAARTWEEALAWFTSALCWMLSPELVVFGGRASAVLDVRGLTSVASRLESPQARARLAVSEFGADAVVMGAAALPMGEFFSLPVLRPEQAGSAHARSAEAIA